MRLALKLVVCWMVCWSAIAFAPHAFSQSYQGKQLVRTELLADTNATVPGKPFTIGLLLRMAPGWHTYWKFSGDAGLPTELKWKLPPGWKIGEIQWPIPLKTIDPGDIQTYGYVDEVLLTQEITPPPKIENSTIKLVADASWLVCEKICIPGRNIGIGAAGIGKQPAGEHGAFPALSAFAAAKLAGTECGNCRMGSGWVRSSLVNHQRDIGKLSGG